MNNSNGGNSKAGGIGFFGLLQIVLIVLKLCGVITWSWWVVFAPVWFIVVVHLGIFAFLYWLIKK